MCVRRKKSQKRDVKADFYFHEHTLDLFDRLFNNMPPAMYIHIYALLHRGCIHVFVVMCRFHKEMNIVTKTMHEFIHMWTQEKDMAGYYFIRSRNRCLVLVPNRCVRIGVVSMRCPYDRSDTLQISLLATYSSEHTQRPILSTDQRSIPFRIIDHAHAMPES